MDKNSLNKTVFKTRDEPVEVFFRQKYKGYHVRGQIEEFSDNIYDESLKEKYCYAYYHLRVFVLVSDNHFKQYNDTEYTSFLGMLMFKNAEDFIKRQSNFDLQLAEMHCKSLNKSVEQIINSQVHNPPITIDISEIDFKESDYLKNSIKAKKDTILLSIGLYLDRVVSPKTLQIIKGYPKRIHQLLAYHFSNNPRSHFEEATAGFLSGLYEIAYFNLDYESTDEKQYNNILSYIGDLSIEWLLKRKITKQYLRSLNSFITAIGHEPYPLNDFCYQFLDDLLKELAENKKICRCELCGDVFKFKAGKKYCTLLSEGKDCGKKARNKRFYDKHKELILPKARKTTKELRALYREKGIRK